MPYGYGGFLNPYVMIFVISIVLQWFRVGCNRDGVGGAGSPEPGLLNNGGLFIIAMFLLVFCSYGRNYTPVMIAPTVYRGANLELRWISTSILECL
jgi:hypothetical protein